MPVLLHRFLSDDSSLEYKYYKLKLAEMQRMSQTMPGADQKPMAAECAVRAMPGQSGASRRGSSRDGDGGCFELKGSGAGR